MESFRFAVDPRLRTWSRLFGIRAERCCVGLSPTELTVSFGQWSLTTDPGNVAGVEVTGPYRWWKVAGPPRLSLADRGITFATTASRGVCIELRQSTGGIDPLHLIRHPNVTVTVAEPERFAEQLRALASTPAASEEITEAPTPESPASIRETLRALVRWARRDRSVEVSEHAVGTVDAPPPVPRAEHAQRLDDGVGPVFHRRYRIVVDTPMSATEAMATLQADPNLMTPAAFASFQLVAGIAGQMRVGDRFVVKLAGPWDGPVEVADVGPTSFRLVTMAGHMEAGVIDFSVHQESAHQIALVIESWARSGDAAMDLLYDRLGVAKNLQAEMWVEACEAFAHAVGGGPPHRAVEVVSEREAR